MIDEDRKAKYLIERFHGNKDHAIVCVLEIKESMDQFGFSSFKYPHDYWNKVLEILKAKP